jgi:hypothetical protein
MPPSKGAIGALSLVLGGALLTIFTVHETQNADRKVRRLPRGCRESVVAATIRPHRVSSSTLSSVNAMTHLGASGHCIILVHLVQPNRFLMC